MLPKTSQAGVGLIEVLITVLVMAISLLAIAALQMWSLQLNQSAYIRSQANILAYDIIDRIRINRGPAAQNIGFYTVGFEGGAGANALAAADINAWRAEIARRIPAGEGAIDCSVATNVCTVTLRWTEEGLFGDDEENSESITQFTYSTAI